MKNTRRLELALKDEYGNIIDLVEWEKQIRADAFDDFVHKVKEHHYVLSDVVTNSTDYGMFTFGVEQIAEELKEQKKWL